MRLLVIAPADRRQFLAALRAGARGFIGRQAGARELVGCVDAVRRGEWGLPRSLIGDLVDEHLMLTSVEHFVPPAAFTERERHVLRLLAQGASAQRIGQELYVSESTVRSDINAVTRKLRVANRMQAVTEAIRLGLIEPE